MLMENRPSFSSVPFSVTAIVTTGSGSVALAPVKISSASCTVLRQFSKRASSSSDGDL